MLLIKISFNKLMLFSKASHSRFMACLILLYIFNYRCWTQGIFARWTDNPNIEDLIQAQQEHPLFDDFWKQRQVPLSQIKTPLLTCASWSTQGLHNRGSFEGFKQAASEEKWLYVHGRKEWERYASCHL